MLPGVPCVGILPASFCPCFPYPVLLSKESKQQHRNLQGQHPCTLRLLLSSICTEPLCLIGLRPSSDRIQSIRTVMFILMDHSAYRIKLRDKGNIPILWIFRAEMLGHCKVCTGISHCRMEMSYCRTGTLHSRTGMIHSRTEMSHSRTGMLHSRTEMIHSRAGMLHSRMGMLRSHAECLTVARKRFAAARECFTAADVIKYIVSITFSEQSVQNTQMGQTVNAW